MFLSWKNAFNTPKALLTYKKFNPNNAYPSEEALIGNYYYCEDSLVNDISQRFWQTWFTVILQQWGNTRCCLKYRHALACLVSVLYMSVFIKMSKYESGTSSNVWKYNRCKMSGEIAQRYRKRCHFHKCLIDCNPLLRRHLHNAWGSHRAGYWNIEVQ